MPLLRYRSVRKWSLVSLRFTLSLFLSLMASHWQLIRMSYILKRHVFPRLSTNTLLTWMPNPIQYQYEYKRNSAVRFFFVHFSSFSLSLCAKKELMNTHRCYKIPFYYSFCWFFVYKFRLSFEAHQRFEQCAQPTVHPFHSTSLFLPAPHSIACSFVRSSSPSAKLHAVAARLTSFNKLTKERRINIERTTTTTISTTTTTTM